jgi:hypothetical protein
MDETFAWHGIRDEQSDADTGVCSGGVANVSFFEKEIKPAANRKKGLIFQGEKLHVQKR